MLVIDFISSLVFFCFASPDFLRSVALFLLVFHLSLTLPGFLLRVRSISALPVFVRFALVFPSSSPDLLAWFLFFIGSEAFGTKWRQIIVARAGPFWAR